MTPQPEPTPDEILARIIVEKNNEISELKALIAGHSDGSFKHDLKESESELAMLESYQAAINYISAQPCHCVLEGENPSHCPRCDALIASYDAIRGMRG